MRAKGGGTGVAVGVALGGPDVEVGGAAEAMHQGTRWRERCIGKVGRSRGWKRVRASRVGGRRRAKKGGERSTNNGKCDGNKAETTEKGWGRVMIVGHFSRSQTSIVRRSG